MSARAWELVWLLMRVVAVVMGLYAVFTHDRVEATHWVVWMCFCELRRAGCARAAAGGTD